MRMKSFRVQKFRNIDDSGPIELHGPLTCVVGKNQSGKSALLRALHKFNPHHPQPYDMRRDWPRGQRNKRNKEQVVCEVQFELEPDEAKALDEIARQNIVAPRLNVIVKKTYEGKFDFQFPEDPNLFPNPLDPNVIEVACQKLPTPSEALGDNFRQTALECAAEIENCIKKGRFGQIEGLLNQHKAKMEQYVSDQEETQRENYRQFITNYTSIVMELGTELNDQLTRHKQARDYIAKALPTFTYMDDYKRFRGRASLDTLRDRRNSRRGDLSEEDETFLMILKLAGLDLNELIKQGESGEHEVIHDRQMDLQDAATTLTRDVAGRWGQNDYEVQFRVDNQIFFTEIQEKEKNIGMIPLEEQSKGFQWFFSFDLHFMHDSDGTFENCVLLLDEPGLHLHPGGQEDLLKRLDAYAEKNTLIYTTHLPFLVDLRDPKRIRVIRQSEAGAVISDDLGSSQADEKLTLQSALGMRANQCYLVSQRNLLVEGVHDFWVITELSRVFERDSRVCLPEDVLITACGSASKIVPMATFMIGQNLTVAALFDSDHAGKEAEEKLRENWITCYKNATATTLQIGNAVEGVGDVVTIEDLFPQDYYLQKTLESHKQKLVSKGIAIDKINLQGTGPILPRLDQYFKEKDVLFNKGSVAKRIRRDLIRSSKVNDLPNGVAKKAELLLKKLHDVFDA